MFQAGEHVVHGAAGPCLIKEIASLRMSPKEKKRRYYILQPLCNAATTIYSPVDNGKVRLRKTVSKAEAVKLLDSIGEIEETEVPGEKMREECYRSIASEADCRKMCGLVKMLIHRKEERIAAGKKFTSIDDRYLSDVMKKLCCELSVALDMDEEQIQERLKDLILA